MCADIGKPGLDLGNTMRISRGLGFGQERVGQDNKTFTLWKFRSMRKDAERHTGPVWATAQDCRVTRVGKYLRRTRLDEFPQTLTAVKRGDSLANYETVRLRKDGRKISVSLTDSPIRGDGGRIQKTRRRGKARASRRRRHFQLPRQPACSTGASCDCPR